MEEEEAALPGTENPYSNFDFGQVQTSVTMADPYMSALRYGLLESARDLVNERQLRGYGGLDEEYTYTDPVTGELRTGVRNPLDYRVAPLSLGEETGITTAQEGLGAYLPFLESGETAIQGGQNILTDQASPYLTAAYTAMGGGQDFLDQAAQLAAAQRATPYTYQQGAAQGIGQATQLGAAGTAQAQQLAAAQRAVPYTYQQGAAQGLGQGTQLGTTLGLQGIASLAGAAGMYNPQMAGGFFNPFEEVAVQRALADIGRQGQIAQQDIGARAVQSGAFGGSRQAVAEQELQRNVLQQQANTAAQLRAAGYQTAAQQAQQAFEQSRGRQIQGAQLTGQLGTNLGQLGQAGSQALGQLGLQYGQLAQQDVNQLAQLAQQQANIGFTGSQALGQLGLQYGQLAQQDVNQLAQLAQQQGALGQGIGALAGQAGTLGAQLGQLGVQQAGIGEIGQNITNAQLQNIFAAGGLERGVAQSALDAARMSTVQREAFPYQQLGFLSDIYAGVPSAQSVSTGVAGTQTSPFQQAIGLGISGLSAAAGAQRAGLFG